MGRRIDFLDDPEAPAANSLVLSVNVAVADDGGRLLLIRRSDNDNWALPGGAMDPGESISDAAVRETKEETGVDCEITGIVGIYTNPAHVILYTSDGEVRQECSVVFTAKAVSGEPTPSSESTEVRWVSMAELDGFTMHPSMRQRVGHYLDGRDRPYIG
ncbi:NUDIX domain-containing protein [Solirubrobacter ginsenosidimutans]|uniref:NUDIX domain-containing protein n=1 Tax=Solirubrobacter ginsenosidimutans TaxID=490573 RepID=A0A9X3MQJ5_9ACTN|nr:NUDIX domain-containing protein [Solirubrobacter ginsenosidimutans]